MKTLLLLLFVSTAMLQRLALWLALVQQKEYRIDRLKLFLSTQEGKHALGLFLPTKAQLSPKAWKRPKLTPRIFVSLLFVVTANILILIVGWQVTHFFGLSLMISLISLLILQILIYVFLPILVIFSLIPGALVAYFLTNQVAVRAKTKIAQSHPLIIGITGSYGKTSTKLLLSHILSTKYQVFTTPQSFNTLYSVSQSITDNYKGEEVVVLEYGAYKMGEIARLCQVVPPKLAVITGLTQQHLGIFGSVEKIIQAKSELVQALPPDGVVFYNGQDPGAQTIAQVYAGSKTAFNSPGHANIQSAGITTEGKLELVIDNVIVKTQLYGLHYQAAVEAALVVGEYLGVARSQIIARLMSFVPTTNFTRVIKKNDGTMVLDDGLSSNPTGYRAMLDLAKAMKGQPKVLLFAGIVDLGAESEAIHLELARQTRGIFDKILYVGEIGRSEFEKVMNEAVVSQQAEVIKILDGLPAGALITIEGKLPGWLTPHLNKIKENRS